MPRPRKQAKPRRFELIDIIENVRAAIPTARTWNREPGTGKYKNSYLADLVFGKHFDFIGAGFANEQDKREAWHKLKNDILVRHVQEAPGTRPYAWWEYDAPEQRRRLVAGKDPELITRFWFGVPCGYGGVHCKSWPVYESEASYLRRHDLLYREEIELLTDEDFKGQKL